MAIDVFNFQSYDDFEMFICTLHMYGCKESCKHLKTCIWLLKYTIYLNGKMKISFFLKYFIFISYLACHLKRKSFSSILDLKQYCSINWSSVHQHIKNVVAVSKVSFQDGPIHHFCLSRFDFWDCWQLIIVDLDMNLLKKLMYRFCCVSLHSCIDKIGVRNYLFGASLNFSWSISN